ncbi:hypothetical protein AMS58_10940 [Pseudoalteromonas porphyrae]|nr:hypothetical protein AMS58_10940 [Pseudoalteromonas porphyrae]
MRQIVAVRGRVDLCGLKFVQSRGDLIAARGLESSGLSKNRAKLPRPAHAPRKNPLGSACLKFILRYRLFMGSNHITQALPCLNTKHAAAKSITKGQHDLIFIRLKVAVHKKGLQILFSNA